MMQFQPNIYIKFYLFLGKLNYKGLVQSEISGSHAFIAEAEEIYRKNQLPVLIDKSSKKNGIHYKFDSLLPLFEQLFSTDEKFLILEQIRDEIVQIDCSLFEYLEDGSILNDLLEVFQLDQILLSKLLLQIFQNLIDNTPQFASFIQYNENTFLALFNIKELHTDLFILFTKVIIEIPDFADDMHSNDIILTLFNICYDLKENINDDLIQAISTFFKILIQKDKLISDIYETDESKTDISDKLVFIVHSLADFLDLKLQQLKEEIKDSYELKKATEQILSIRLYPVLLLIDILCHSSLSSITQLFDEDIGNMIYYYFSKTKYVIEISDILISFVNMYPNEAIDFIKNFELISPLFRHGQNSNYRWIILRVFIAFAEISPEIADQLDDYEYLQLFENDFNDFTPINKELVLSLFCILCINTTQAMISRSNLDFYFDELMDATNTSNNDFIVIFLKAIEALTCQPNFILETYVDTEELGDKLEDYLINSENEEIIALSRRILDGLK